MSRFTKVEPVTQNWVKGNRNKEKDKNLYSSLKIFLCCFQVMGLLPLDNILGGKDKIRFRWTNFKVLFSFFYMLCLAVAIVYCTISGIQYGYTMSTITSALFYGGSLINTILHLRLAQSWPAMLRKWCHVDEIMNGRYGYPKGVDTQIRLFAIIYLILGLGDHLLSSGNGYHSMKREFKENYTASSYYNRTFSSIFNYVNYSVPLGIYISIITTHANLSWAFNDWFIIMMSILMTSRYKQIRNKISQVFYSPKSVQFWKDIREDYDRLSDLCTDLDDNISLIILLSYFQNICFILVQLYHSLQPLKNRMEKAYFIFSFSYLAFKTGSVSLYAASINDESKAPAIYLINVPSEYYNLEIKRMLVRISFDTVFLSGWKIFKVTRGLVLSITSAIVTYELLLIQLPSLLLVNWQTKKNLTNTELN